MLSVPNLTMSASYTLTVFTTKGGVTVDGQTVGPLTLSLDAMDAGSTETGKSWTSLTSNLVNRDDLGPFRLGFLEAVVRIADWLASDTTEARS